MIFLNKTNRSPAPGPPHAFVRVGGDSSVTHAWRTPGMKSIDADLA